MVYQKKKTYCQWFIGKHDAECERINISAIDGIEEIDYQGIYGYGFGWLISSPNVIKKPSLVYDYMAYCGYAENLVWT